MSTCTVSKHLKVLGTGSITNGAVTVTGFTNSGALPPTLAGRNVWVTITSSTHIGQRFLTKCLADGGTSLTLRDANPFAT